MLVRMSDTDHRAVSVGEIALLRGIRARVGNRAHAGLRLGIGDDCALVRPAAGEEIAVTTDLSLAGRHFRLEWHPPEVIGHRTLVRGLSDLAAMGARPLAAFLSLGVPYELTVSTPPWMRPWVDRFYDGLLALAEEFETPLAGGDLSQAPMALADIVLVGAVPRGKALLRSGARPGHVLYVTGTLGGAAAGLRSLTELGEAAQATIEDPVAVPKYLDQVLEPHFHPKPRIKQGIWLRSHQAASAAMDLSDGLSTDLGRLCEESGVAAEINTTALPIHGGATLTDALHGGEDYELLFTAPASATLPASIDGVPVTRIGRILRPEPGKPRIFHRGASGSEPLKAQGWEHFRS